MKAIRVQEFGAPEVMRLEDVDIPLAGARQVVVRVAAAGVNPVEAYIRSGLYPRKPELPYTPGTDGAGIVEAIGAEVKRVRVGARVYVAGSLSGTYAERALCLETQVYALPDALSFAQGAAVGVPYATAYRALFDRAQAQPGETVFIHGASGGVGVAALQLARAMGLRVIGTGGTDEGRKLVTEQGAHHVLDHKSENYLQEVISLTDGRGADVIIEMLANVNLNSDLSVLAMRGRVVVVGSRGPVEIDPRQTMGRDASIHGMSLNNAGEADLSRIHAALVAGLENGTLRPVVGRELPLAAAARAHEQVMAAGAYGKIVLQTGAE